MNGLTPVQARIIRKALLRHDGGTLAPWLNQDQQKELTAALDALTLELRYVYEPEPDYDNDKARFTLLLADILEKDTRQLVDTGKAFFDRDERRRIEEEIKR